MLDRHFTEPRHRQSDITFDNARVTILIEPVDQAQKAMEVEVGTLNGVIRFDFEDMELHDASKMGLEPPVAVYPTRRAVVMELNASTEPSVKVARR